MIKFKVLMTRLVFIWGIIAYFALHGMQLYAQQLDVELKPNEQPVFEKALSYFEAGDFESAKENFSQLLSLYPREAFFNYSYGACLVNENSRLPEAITFLKYASQKGQIEAYYYLGLAYHLQYMFDKAIASYEKFQEIADQKVQKKYPIERQINMAHNGEELVKYAYKLDVIKNKKIKADNFYYSYEISTTYGEIVIIPESFKSKADKKRDYNGLMYVSHLHKKAFFSSYGDDKNNSLDIYVVDKVEGVWGIPQKVAGLINTLEDESFPFLHPNGSVLYFSSKGHNSMGGYDIFKSNYDPISKSWQEPENLDFPINTPLDDIQYVTDMFSETAYFASNRETESGRISVYQIIIEQNPQLQKLDNINDVRNRARLEITPLASNEMIQRDNEDISIANYNETIDSLEIVDESMGLAQDTLRNRNYSTKLTDTRDVLIVVTNLQVQYQEMSIAALSSMESTIDNIDDLNAERTRILNSNMQKEEKEKKLHLIDAKIKEQASILDESIQLAHFYGEMAEQYTTRVGYYTNELERLEEKNNPEDTDLAELTQIEEELLRYQKDMSSPLYMGDKYSKLENYNIKLKEYETSLELLNSQIADIENQISIITEKAISTDDIALQQQYIQQAKSLRRKQANFIAEYKNIKTQIIFTERDIRNGEINIFETSLLLNELEQDSTATKPENVAELEKEAKHIANTQRQKELEELASLQDEILDNQYFTFPVPGIEEMVAENNKLRAQQQTNQEIINNYAKLSNDTSINSPELSQQILTTQKTLEKIDLLTASLDTITEGEERADIVAQINELQTEIISQIKDLAKTTQNINNTWIASNKQYDKVTTSIQRDKIKSETNNTNADYSNELVTEANYYYHISDSLNIIADNASKPNTFSKEVVEYYKQQSAYYEELGNRKTQHAYRLNTTENQPTDTVLIATNDIINNETINRTDSSQNTVAADSTLIASNDIIDNETIVHADSSQNTVAADSTLIASNDIIDNETIVHADSSQNTVADDSTLIASNDIIDNETINRTDSIDNVENPNIPTDSLLANDNRTIASIEPISAFVDSAITSINNTYNNEEHFEWNDINNYYELAEKQIIKTNKERDESKRKESATDASEKFVTARNKHTEYAEQELEKNIEKYLVYSNSFNSLDTTNIKENNDVAYRYYNEATNYHTLASELLMQAEETTDKEEKQQLIIDAARYEELSISNYEKVFYALDENNTITYKTIEPNNENQITSIEEISETYETTIKPLIYKDYETEITIIEEETVEILKEAEKHLEIADSLGRKIELLQQDYLASDNELIKENTGEEILKLNEERIKATENANKSIAAYQNKQFEMNKLLIEKEYDKLNDSQKQEAAQIETDFESYKEQAESILNNNTSSDTYVLLGDIIIMGENLLEAQKRLIRLINDSEQINIVFNKRMDNIGSDMIATEAWIAENNIKEAPFSINSEKNIDETIKEISLNTPNEKTQKKFTKLETEKQKIDQQEKQTLERINQLKTDITLADNTEKAQLERDLQKSEKELKKIKEAQILITNEIFDLAYETAQENLSRTKTTYAIIDEYSKNLQILADTLYNEAKYISSQAITNRDNIGEVAYQAEIERAQEKEAEALSILVTTEYILDQDDPDLANSFYSDYEQQVIGISSNKEEIASNDNLVESTDTVQNNQVDYNSIGTDTNESSQQNYTIYAEIFYKDSKEEGKYNQYNEKSNRINKKINQTDEKIDRINQEDELSNQDIRKINRLEKKKEKQLLKSQSINQERNLFVYEYSNEILDTLDCSFQIVRNKADSLLDEANLLHTEATQIRVELGQTQNLSDEIIQLNTNRAIALESQAIEMQQEAIKLLIADDPSMIETPLLAEETETKLDSVIATNIEINETVKNDTINENINIAELTPVTKKVDSINAPNFHIYPIDTNIPKAYNQNELLDTNGLLFRIQIAAYYKLMPEETFNGLAPLFHEQIRDNTIIRYMVGTFYTYEGAAAALPKVRLKGFDDAFIVAYLNGERISIYEARRLLETNYAYNNQVQDELTMVEENTEIADNSTYQVLAINENGTNTENENTNNTETIETNQTSNLIGNTYTNVNTTTNVFITVQIGAAKTIIDANKFYGIIPDYVEYANNGYIRHLNGTYYDLNSAINAQNRIRQQGIQDAFVAAYANGKKITINEALQLLNDMTESERNSNLKTTQLNDTTDLTDINDTVNIEIEAIQETEFFVQIGAYKTTIDAELMQRFTGIAETEKVTLVEYDNGLKVYRIGPLTNYERATYFQQRAIANGIVDAFIVVIKNGKRVPLNQVL